MAILRTSEQINMLEVVRKYRNAIFKQCLVAKAEARQRKLCVCQQEQQEFHQEFLCYYK
jgi:hypothetical protein